MNTSGNPFSPFAMVNVRQLPHFRVNAIVVFFPAEHKTVFGSFRYQYIYFRSI